MSEGVSRTFIGSVVCVDLVGYSKRSVEQQIAVKDAFNRLLARALEPVAEDDRIILDTGDGAAISFLGDPEQGLAVGLALRDAMRDNAAALGATEAESAMRMGINLGPVKLAVDLNGYPKIIGDGLNVAERIMGFAKPGQIAVSRSFVEMVSRLNDQNAKLFRFDGAKTDKNAREHQVYVVEPGAKLRKGGSTAEAAGGSSALVAFLEDNVKVGVAGAILVAVIAGEGYLLARKARAGVPTVAATEAPAPAPAKAETKAEPPKAETPRPAPKVEKAEPPKAAARPEAAPQKPEPKAEPKVEPRAEPPKTEAKPARKDDAKPAPEAVSPVQPNLVSIAPLNFPNEAAARGYTTGSVKARLTIDAAGNVTKVQILSAQPARGFFDEEATRSLRDWKFDRGPANRQYIADITFKK